MPPRWIPLANRESEYIETTDVQQKRTSYVFAKGIIKDIDHRYLMDHECVLRCMRQKLSK